MADNADTPETVANEPTGNNMGPVPQLTAQGIPSGMEMGVAFDDNGNLLPGWALDPTGKYYTQTDPNYVDSATVAQASQDRQAYQNSQALTSDGMLKEGYSYDEFGTIVKSSHPVTNTTASSSADAGASDHGPAYDDEGNLMPGFSKNEDGDAVWVGAGYNDATGKTIEPVAEEPNKADHGPSRDDEGNLMPGWEYSDELGDYWVGSTHVNAATAATAQANREAAGIGVSKKKPLIKNDFASKADWRVRLSLAPHATYLYKAAKGPEHILFPLLQTDGVIFPYTPQVQVNYTANYEGTDLAHNNYKMHQYKNSEVGNVQITAMFTAQDTAEANYLLAVIHFFRSATKMFYGQDNDPKAGTPPPLVYLSGYGAHQFDNHPLALTSFNMSLPDDVDYIRAGSMSSYGSMGAKQTDSPKSTSLWDTIKSRLSGSNLNKGGVKDAPVFSSLSNKEATYVPTKVQFTIAGVPIVTRNDISNNFSLEKYASGELLRGSKRQTGGGGIW